jgi:DNA-directed RNA polymerase I and III subunit RPAC2
MSVNEVKIKRAETAFELRGTGPPTSRTFVLGDEDHTLGNALRHVLMNDTRVNFAGYCVPHPSEPVVHIRVQTNPEAKKTSGARRGGDNDDDSDSSEEEIVDGENSSGQLTAIDALKDACHTLAAQCDFVLEQLEIAMPEVKVDRKRLKRLEEDMMFSKEEVEDDHMEE